MLTGQIVLDRWGESLSWDKYFSDAQAGGVLRQQTIKDVCELADYDIVVNCAGLRAGKLFGDDKVIAVRWITSRCTDLACQGMHHCFFPRCLPHL